ncbi:WG repeat-containing protein [Dokdonia sinensis]|nr:WG repeat-containing protein [Dokdonia sinensis]
MKTHLILIFNLIFALTFGQQENLIKFQDDSRLNGYKNAEGEIIVKPMYKHASVFNQGLALVSTDAGWTIINSKGNELVEYGEFPGTVYSNLEYKYIRHKKNDKWGFIDRKGNLIIDYQYDETKDFNEEMASVQIDGKWGFINIENELIIKPIFENTQVFSDNFAAIQLNEKWGFIDKEGNQVIEPKYKSVYNFSEGLCAVNSQPFDMANGGWANEIIDKSGKIVFTGEFYFFNGYSNGIADYWEGYHFSGKHIFIDRKGNVIRAE